MESVEEKLLNLSEEDKFDWKEIFQLFHKPNVINATFKFKKVDEKRIKEILVERHDFSQERIDKQIEKLHEINEELKQKDLGKWF